MPDQPLPNFQALLNFAHLLADQSAIEIARHFRQPLEVANKLVGDGFDPVTEADRSAERIMRELVAEHWPDHDFFGEEFENEDRNSKYSWCVDPIDGTRSFIMGYPLWGTLIGLKKSGAPFLGVMNQPFTGERFWTSEHATHYRGPDGERILQTRPCPDLKDATLSTTDPGYFEPDFEQEKYDALAGRTRLNRFGGDCYAYCMLAAGNVDLVIEAGLQPFDIMALIPIITRAGGMITTWSGGDPINGGRILATGDPALHEKVLKLLRD